MPQKEQKGKKLNVNWDDLFPSDELDIAGCVIDIEPLGVRKLARLMRKVRSLGNELGEAGINFENYSNPESLITLASVVLEKCPEVIAEASGVCLEDIERLPIEYQLKIVDAVLKVNIKSKDVLEKNFESLAATLASLLGSKSLEA